MSADYEVVTIEGRPAIRMTGRRVVRVAGSSYRQPHIEHVLASVGREAVAWLVPEPENPNDDNAVAVVILGGTVGYISRDEAAGWQAFVVAVEDQLKAGATCSAMLYRHGGEAHVKLRLPALERANFLIPMPIPLPGPPIPTWPLAGSSPPILVPVAPIAVPTSPQAPIPAAPRVQFVPLAPPAVPEAASSPRRPASVARRIARLLGWILVAFTGFLLLFIAVGFGGYIAKFGIDGATVAVITLFVALAAVTAALAQHLLRWSRR